jgi:hypothetical protein
VPTGQVPALGPSNGNNVDVRSLGGTGLAIGLDGGIRFARQWYAGLTLEHADLGSGSTNGLTGVSDSKATTNQVGAVVAIITNPDKPSLFGELGLALRWFDVTFPGNGAPPSPGTYTSPEGFLGAGVWIPSGRHFRLLPEATLSLGTYSNPSNGAAGSTITGSAPSHAFFMVGVAGFYNADL